MSRCSICGDQLDRARGARAGRCRTCATYHYRNGRDRSDEVMAKLTERDIEREHRRRLR